MIGRIRGKLIEKKPPMLMVETHGVGYVLQAPLSTIFNLPSVDHPQEIILHTHYVVREDAHLLFGFATTAECEAFQALIKINGVGPKVALAILSGLSVAELQQVLVQQDVARLQKLPGIGAKTAQRILMEMPGRVLSKQESVLAHGKDSSQYASEEEIIVEESIMALVSLGYKPQEAQKAVSKVADTKKGCEHVIRTALQGLARA